MTDNEIINALECCASKDENACDNCPCLNTRCIATTGEVIDLIHRQEAEIKSLKNECFCLANERDAYKDVLDTAVTEAIKEFAERLKGKKRVVFTAVNDSNYAVTVENINNLVKEMAGE